MKVSFLQGDRKKYFFLYTPIAQWAGALMMEFLLGSSTFDLGIMAGLEEFINDEIEDGTYIVLGTKVEKPTTCEENLPADLEGSPTYVVPDVPMAAFSTKGAILDELDSGIRVIDNNELRILLNRLSLRDTVKDMLVGEALNSGQRTAQKVMEKVSIKDAVRVSDLLVDLIKGAAGTRPNELQTVMSRLSCGLRAYIKDLVVGRAEQALRPNVLPVSTHSVLELVRRIDEFELQYQEGGAGKRIHEFDLEAADSLLDSIRDILSSLVYHELESSIRDIGSNLLVSNDLFASIRAVEESTYILEDIAGVKRLDKATDIGARISEALLVIRQYPTFITKVWDSVKDIERDTVLQYVGEGDKILETPAHGYEHLIAFDRVNLSSVRLLEAPPRAYREQRREASYYKVGSAARHISHDLFAKQVLEEGLRDFLWGMYVSDSLAEALRGVEKDTHISSNLIGGLRSFSFNGTLHVPREGLRAIEDELLVSKGGAGKRDLSSLLDITDGTEGKRLVDKSLNTAEQFWGYRDPAKDLWFEVSFPGKTKEKALSIHWSELATLDFIRKVNLSLTKQGKLPPRFMDISSNIFGRQTPKELMLKHLSQACRGKVMDLSIQDKFVEALRYATVSAYITGETIAATWLEYILEGYLMDDEMLFGEDFARHYGLIVDVLNAASRDGSSFAETLDYSILAGIEDRIATLLDMGVLSEVAGKDGLIVFEQPMASEEILRPAQLEIENPYGYLEADFGEIVEPDLVGQPREKEADINEVEVVGDTQEKEANVFTSTVAEREAAGAVLDGTEEGLEVIDAKKEIRGSIDLEIELGDRGESLAVVSGESIEGDTVGTLEGDIADEIVGQRPYSEGALSDEEYEGFRVEPSKDDEATVMIGEEIMGQAPSREGSPMDGSKEGIVSDRTGLVPDPEIAGARPTEEGGELGEEPKQGDRAETFKQKEGIVSEEDTLSTRDSLSDAFSLKAIEAEFRKNKIAFLATGYLLGKTEEVRAEYLQALEAALAPKPTSELDMDLLEELVAVRDVLREAFNPEEDVEGYRDLGEGYIGEDLLAQSLMYLDRLDVIDEPVDVRNWGVGRGIPDPYSPDNPYNSYHPWTTCYDSLGLLHHKWVEQGEGDWKLNKDLLEISASSQGETILYRDDFSYRDYRFSTNFTVKGNEDKAVGVVLNYVNENNYIKFLMHGGDFGGSLNMGSPMRLTVVKNGVENVLGVAINARPWERGRTHNIFVDVEGDRIRLWVDGFLQYDLYVYGLPEGGRSFGFAINRQSGVVFDSFTTCLVEDDPSHPNHPENPNSPNYPRARGRIEGYINPALGDDGLGKIGRWESINLDALEVVITQIIEQYLRDRDWYSTIRCREALWNMYHRIEWWVKQQTDPQNNDYPRVLLMMRDCIETILNPRKVRVYRLDVNHKEGLSDDLQYSSHWVAEETSATARLSSGSATIEHTTTLKKDGYLYFSFAANLSQQARLTLLVNGEQVWSHERLESGDMSFHGVYYDLPPGTHHLKWVFTGGGEESIARIRLVRVTELEDENPDKPKRLPLCLAPYDYTYEADYLNHFDGKVIERVLFDMQSLPKLNDFPDFFRYVSTSEDQEWELVRRAGGNEQVGNENILKMPLSKLSEGHSTKITLDWRFKRSGYIRFKYLASTSPGNGLIFFINSNQVGGEWNQESEWKEVQFRVTAGQTYRFDWLVRKRNHNKWGLDAIYIKDVACVETVDTSSAPTPPDLSKHGGVAWLDEGYDWITETERSVTRTVMGGNHPDPEVRERTLTLVASNECDGELSFSYRLDSEDEPSPSKGTELFYNESFLEREQVGTSSRGSEVVSDKPWSLNGELASTRLESPIVYEIDAASGSEVVLKGAAAVEGSEKQIDHYVEQPIPPESLDFSVSGVNRWNVEGGVLSLSEIRKGYGNATAVIDAGDGGYFDFSLDQDLRPSEKFEVVVNGVVVFRSEGEEKLAGVRVPLEPGYNQVTFHIYDEFTEEGDSERYERKYSYGGGRGRPFMDVTRMGNSVTVTRDWETLPGHARTFSNESVVYKVVLNPTASFTLNELLEITGPTEGSGFSLNFEDDFNTPDTHSPLISMTSDWKWQDIFTRYGAKPAPGVVNDGVWYVENAHGRTNTMYLQSLNLSKDGFVQFEYGGKFGPYEYLELYDNGRLVWKGRQGSSSPGGTFITVPLSAGQHSLAWVYKDLGGTTYTPTLEGETPHNPDLTCYPGGEDVVEVPYNLLNSSRHTPAGSELVTSGRGGQSDGSRILLNTNRGEATRDITAGKGSDIHYTETLQVVPGTGLPVTGLYEVDSPKVLGDFKEAADIIYCSTDAVRRKQTTKTMYQLVDSDADVDVEFNYSTFLSEYDAGVGNKSQRYHEGPRGVFRFYVIPASKISPAQLENFEYGQWADYIYLQEDGNTSLAYTTHTFGLMDGRLTSPLLRGMGRSFKASLPQGEPCYLVWELQDTFDDLDYSIRNGRPVGYQVAIQGIKVLAKQTKVDASLADDTYVLVEVVDKRTGKVINTRKYSAGYHTVSLRVNRGESLLVRYILHQGVGKISKGTAVLAGGGYREKWDPYCRDVNGKYHPWEGPIPEPESIELPEDDSWVFIDAIRVFESGSQPPQSVLSAVVTHNGQVVRTNDYTMSSGEVMIEETITNETDSKQTYYLTLTFHPAAPGAGAVLSEGQYVIVQENDPTPAHISVEVDRVVGRSAVWMGGDEDSRLAILAYTPDDTLVYSKHISVGQLGSFTIKLPYPKYKVIIQPVQGGYVSPVSGREYLSTFRFLSFYAYENWTLQAAPFNSRLDFYIDGVLKGTFGQAESFKLASFPVPKGEHTFKWVFVGGEGENWDFAEIDFIRLTNWVCDSVRITPYCEPGRGNECIEALIKCLIKAWKERPRACVIGRRIWLFT